MKPLSLFEEIHQLSRSIYNECEFSPYTEHPFLNHHSKTSLLLQNALSAYSVGEIHSTYRDEYEAKALPILEHMEAPVNIKMCIQALLLTNVEDKPGVPVLNQSFVKGFKAYMANHTQTSTEEAMIAFFEAETKLSQTNIKQMMKSLSQSYKLHHTNTLIEDLDTAMARENKGNDNDLKMLQADLKVSIWQTTLDELSIYFEKLKPSDLFNVEDTYAMVQSFHKDFNQALLDSTNQTLVDHILEAMIGDKENIDSRTKNMHPSLTRLWAFNAQITNPQSTLLQGHFPQTQVGLVDFIHSITQLPKTLIQKHIASYDASKTIPCHDLTDNIDQGMDEMDDQQAELDFYQSHLKVCHRNAHTLLLHELGLVKLDYYCPQSSLNQLASLSKIELGNWLKASALLHLVDFTDHYRTLLSPSSSQLLFMSGGLKYQSVTQFYWMLLKQCRGNNQLETNQLFFKTLTDCLIATDESYKCFQGVYEEAILLTPSLYQAFNQKKETFGMSQSLSEISACLFDHGIHLYQNGAINSNLFHWWHIRASEQSPLISDTLHEAFNANKHLFDEYMDASEAKALLAIRMMFAEDLFMATDLNLDTAYAVADYLNLEYYLKKSSDEPNTLWALIQENAEYSDETDFKVVNDALFTPFNQQIKRIPKMIQSMFKACEKDAMPALSPNLDLRVLKEHLVTIPNTPTEKYVKLLHAFDPDAVLRFKTDNLYEAQKKSLGQWINPMIQYMPKTEALKAYHYLLNHLNLNQVTYYTLQDSIFQGLFPNKLNIFLNLLSLDAPLNMLTPEEMNQYSYGKILEISKKNFKTIAENMDINLSRINPVVHSLIQKKRWQTDPVWTNFYFNWISYCHTNFDMLKPFIDAYITNPSISMQLNCPTELRATRLISAYPEKSNAFIDHYLNSLPQDTRIDIAKSPVFQPFQYEIKWVYFMHRLKNKVDLDPMRQHLHDAIVSHMNTFVDNQKQSFGFFTKAPTPSKQIKYSLYQIALNKRPKPLNQSHFDKLNESNFFQTWFPFDQFKIEGNVAEASINKMIQTFEEKYADRAYLPKALEDNIKTQVNFLTNLLTLNITQNGENNCVIV